jgi:hypothetical protein
VWQPSGRALWSLNARYSAPELGRAAGGGEIGPASDQYSLALIYHELLTGALPAPPLVAGQQQQHEPNLERLPEGDRSAVARALHADPRLRWPCTCDFIFALRQASFVGGGEADSAVVRPVVLLPRPGPSSRPVMQPGGVLQARLGTNLTADAIRKRLDGFGKQWGARLVAEREGHSLTYQVQTPASLWQRWTGRRPGLEVSLEVGQPEVDAPAGVQVRTEVLLTFRARDCSAEKARELLEAVGPLMVESVRQHLRSSARGRQQERVLWPYPLQVCPLGDGGEEAGPAVECQGKDVSLNGIGFYLPGRLPGAHVRLRLPKTAQTAEGSVDARVVRVQGCGDGWLEVGAVLLPAGEGPPEEGQA